MSGFLYFIPGQANAHTFAKLGLDDRFGPGRSQTRVNANGSPNGMPGVVFHEPTPAGLPKPIEWHEAAGGKYWVGWHATSPPAPLDLQRTGMTLGGADNAYGVRLCDGNEWVVPLVLPCTEADETRTTGLPTKPRCENGTIDMRAADPRYDNLIADARRFLECAEDENAPGADGMYEFAAALLGVGYRIGFIECVALGLFDADTAARCVMLAIDWDFRVQYAAACEVAEALNA